VQYKARRSCIRCVWSSRHTIFREVRWKTPIFSWRAALKNSERIVGWRLDARRGCYSRGSRWEYAKTVEIGLGRIVALYCRSSTLYRIH
jgi:hypothetical protein